MFLKGPKQVADDLIKAGSQTGRGAAGRELCKGMQVVAAGVVCWWEVALRVQVVC